jgi:hypothetical protein
MYFICTSMWTKFYFCEKWMLQRDGGSRIRVTPRNTEMNRSKETTSLALCSGEQRLSPTEQVANSTKEIAVHDVFRLPTSGGPKRDRHEMSGRDRAEAASCRPEPMPAVGKSKHENQMAHARKMRAG